MRIVREIYHQCREQVGEDYPLLIKMSAYDNMKKGLKRDEGVVMAEMMADMGFDGLEVSCGIAEDGFSTIRGDMQTETILTTFPMYKNKNMFFKWIMRNFGSHLACLGELFLYFLACFYNPIGYLSRS